MTSSASKSASYSKVSVKSQTVLPRAIRSRLGIKPGDTLRYRVVEQGASNVEPEDLIKRLQN
jgi:AbrB family looped-hinge helix DNA binding protein